MSAAFALLADAAILVLGGSLKRREKLSGRLADILSQLYLASAAIKRFSEQGHPRDDLPLLRWSCDTALHSMQEQMDGLLRNLPSRPVAWLLRLLVFPLGRHFAPPDDTLGHQLAELLLAPSDVRDRLTDGMFIPAHEDGALGILEDALVEVIAAEPIEKKLREALRGIPVHGDALENLISEALARGLISVPEAEQIQAAESARREVIAVDDFPIDFGKETVHG